MLWFIAMSCVVSDRAGMLTLASRWLQTSHPYPITYIAMPLRPEQDACFGHDSLGNMGVRGKKKKKTFKFSPT